MRIFEDRPKELLEESKRKLWRNVVGPALLANRNEVICTCGHSMAWHPARSVEPPGVCLFPGCACPPQA